METFRKYAISGIVIAAAGLTALGAYAKIWENRQPNQSVENAIVQHIEQYSNHNDLHWTSRGYRVKIDCENKVIDFPAKNWDDSVKKGDSIDLVIRRSFPLFRDELDGIRIEDHK